MMGMTLPAEKVRKGLIQLFAVGSLGERKALATRDHTLYKRAKRTYFPLPLRDSIAAFKSFTR
jgi:hypothetical protein